jgi:hypothetical protein
MRRTATIVTGTGIAIAIFGGGLALAFDGGGPSSAGVTRTATPTAVSPVIPSDTPTATSSEPVATPSSAATQVGRAEAERIALRAVPGGRIQSVELEQEHGRLVWEVNVKSGNLGHKVQVDTHTGEVTRNKAEHDG